MRTLNEIEQLGLWERGQRRHPIDRALLALAAALPEISCESLADWPIGRRNQALTQLHCRCFGARLRAWTQCVTCGEKLEIEMDAELLAAGETEPRNRADEPVTAVGCTFRLPTSRDLARAAGKTQPGAGAVSIAESCLCGGSLSAEWSEEDLAAIGDKLSAADPLAETRLALHCPDCGKDWLGTLDMVSFFWTELEARVRRVLSAIHALAAAYGWSEAEILSLSEHRRALYLEMIQV
jgi:hypothetical protein